MHFGKREQPERFLIEVPHAEPLRRFTAKTLPLLASREELHLHLDERILSLLRRGRLRAQVRLATSACRLLVALLVHLDGCDYPTLLACLNGERDLIYRLALVRSPEEAAQLLQAERAFWQQHLGALRGARLQAERRLVRRALTDRRYGLGSKLEAHGFPLTVRARYGWGYVLVATEPKDVV